MKIINPSVKVIFPLELTYSENGIYTRIEKIGRICYKSEDLITKNSSINFIENILKSGHESVIEHVNVTVIFLCDRGVSHEIVRHRIASYSQESTRYCNYSKNKFGKELTFIKPCFWEEDSEEYKIWYDSMKNIENSYFKLLKSGAKPEQARSVLPNSLKTEIAMTTNLREWRHFLKLRTSEKAHPQMREVANMVKEKFMNAIPILFEDI